MPVSSATIRGPGAVAVRSTCGSRDRHLAREVAAGHRRLGGDQRARLVLGHRAREDAAEHRARLADVAHERARVDAGDARHAAVEQPVEPAALGARRVLALTASRMIAARAWMRSDSIASALTP